MKNRASRPKTDNKPEKRPTPRRLEEIGRDIADLRTQLDRLADQRARETRKR